MNQVKTQTQTKNVLRPLKRKRDVSFEKIMDDAWAHYEYNQSIESIEKSMEAITIRIRKPDINNLMKKMKLTN